MDNGGDNRDSETRRHGPDTDDPKGADRKRPTTSRRATAPGDGGEVSAAGGDEVCGVGGGVGEVCGVGGGVGEVCGVGGGGDEGVRGVSDVGGGEGVSDVGGAGGVSDIGGIGGQG